MEIASPASQQDLKSVASKILALVGNPNVGKSVIFGRLTGKYVTVSNYPGTTVDVSRGIGWFGGSQMQVVDTPGVLSLFPKSEDERVTRDLLLRERPEVVIQVADAKNLRRSLLITLELMELKTPMVLSLNMSDEARERGIEIDVERLSKILGVPVVETVGVTGEGIADLRRALAKASVPTIAVKYLSELQVVYEQLENLLPSNVRTGTQTVPFAARRFVAQTLFYGDGAVWNAIGQHFPAHETVKNQCAEFAKKTVKSFVRPMSILAMDTKQQKSGEIFAEVVSVSGAIKSSWAQKFGKLSMQPWPGYLIAVGVLFALYEFVGVFAAQTLVNLLEKGLFAQILNPAVTKIVETVIPFKFFQEMIVGPYGLFTMALTYALALIFPIVTCFFLFFGFLEDSGYLPRLAVMLDRVFRVMGLNGKAVLPMILGLGCDTMATLTTRVLDTKKEKVIVALLLTLSVPCSAQLGAMLGMIAGLSWKIFAIWLFTVVGTMVGIGWSAAKLLPGVRSPFVMEIPPIRVPQFKNLFRKVRARLLWYVREAVPMFLLGTFLLFISDKIGLLDLVKRACEPVVVHFLGLPQKATEAFIIGFLRRDYGAAGFFMLSQNGIMSAEQITVALIVITLFMPCIAQFFVTIKERGLRTTLGIAAFVLSFSLGVGGLLNWILIRGWIHL